MQQELKFCVVHSDIVSVLIKRMCNMFVAMSKQGERPLWLSIQCKNININVHKSVTVTNRTISALNSSFKFHVGKEQQQKTALVFFFFL